MACALPWRVVLSVGWEWSLSFSFPFQHPPTLPSSILMGFQIQDLPWEQVTSVLK